LGKTKAKSSRFWKAINMVPLIE